jgi:hypothetical protein
MSPLRVRNGSSNDDDVLSALNPEADIGGKAGERVLVAMNGRCGEQKYS